jgi:hypothetical protein
VAVQEVLKCPEAGWLKKISEFQTRILDSGFFLLIPVYLKQGAEFVGGPTALFNSNSTT